MYARFLDECANIKTRVRSGKEGGRKEGRAFRRRRQVSEEEEHGTGKWRGEEYYRFAGARELTVCLHGHSDGQGAAESRRGDARSARMRRAAKTIITE